MKMKRSHRTADLVPKKIDKEMTNENKPQITAVHKLVLKER